jgi:hypothetical protein
MQDVENTRVYHGSSESAQDIALAGALLSRMPEWPRWERLGDVQAALALAESTNGLRVYLTHVSDLTGGSL